MKMSTGQEKTSFLLGKEDIFSWYQEHMEQVCFLYPGL